MLAKSSVAIIVPGGIGTGKNSIGVPVLIQLVTLLAKEFHVTVFSLFKINPGYLPADFEVIDVSSRGAILKVWKLYTAFREMHGRRPFSVIHGFWAMPSGLLAVLFGKVFKIRSIVSVLGGDAISLPAINYGQLQRQYKRWLVMWTLRNATEVLALTKYLLGNLRNAGLERQNVRIIPWGIDVTLFPFNQKPLSSTIDFLHIGNLEPVKDQTTLLRAFKLISDKVPAQLTIIGEGRLASHIKKLTKDLDIEKQVRFMDPIPYNELPWNYQRADILLHTSLSEGQSEVVTEAMSSGVVVCGTAVGLIYDEPQCCVSVGVGDYKLLAERTLDILADKVRREVVQNNARAWAHHHSIHWTVQKIGESYHYG